jgi:heat shock protein HslJ
MPIRRQSRKPSQTHIKREELIGKKPAMIHSDTGTRLTFEGTNVPITIGLGTPTFTRAVTVVILGLIAQDATAQTILGAAPPLAATSWQLVEFQGSDDKTLTPDDGAKYTIEFSSGGRVTARIDCNRGTGTWKSSGPNQLQFGPWALTRAKCPAQSMHDQIVKQWANIRSYVIKDGHLFLSLMADGGIYEFEPSEKSSQ